MTPTVAGGPYKQGSYWAGLTVYMIVFELEICVILKVDLHNDMAC